MIKWEGTCDEASCCTKYQNIRARKRSPWHFTKPSPALTMMKHELVRYHLYFTRHNLGAGLLHTRFFDCCSIYSPIHQNSEESPHDKKIKQKFVGQKPATATLGNCHTSSCPLQVKTQPKENNGGATLSHRYHKKDQEMVPSQNTSYKALW